jgi:predicted Zn finger-like uncharacterized protein
MPITAACPSCGKSLKVPEELLGQTVRCASCGTTFEAPVSETAAPPMQVLAAEDRPIPRPRPRDDDSENDIDDRDLRRHRRDTEPHRGTMILVLGILSLVIAYIGAILGIIAWSMGRKDLRRIDAGEVDYSGRQLTHIGMILGIIGTCLQSFLCLFVIGYMIVVFTFVIGSASKAPIAPVTIPMQPIPKVPAVPD